MDLASFLKKDTLDFPYIYQWGKKIRKRRGKIYYPCLTLENDFSYIYRQEKNSKEGEGGFTIYLCFTLENDFSYIYRWGKNRKKDRKEKFTILVEERHLGERFSIYLQCKKILKKDREEEFTNLVKKRHLGFSMYLSMRKKNSKKKKREDLPSLSHLGEQFSIYLSMKKKNSKKRQKGRIYFYPCQRKTSMEQEKFKKGKG